MGVPVAIVADGEGAVQMGVRLSPGVGGHDHDAVAREVRRSAAGLAGRGEVGQYLGRVIDVDTGA